MAATRALTATGRIALPSDRAIEVTRFQDTLVSLARINEGLSKLARSDIEALLRGYLEEQKEADAKYASSHPPGIKKNKP